MGHSLRYSCQLTDYDGHPLAAVALNCENDHEAIRHGRSFAESCSDWKRWEIKHSGRLVHRQERTL